MKVPELHITNLNHKRRRTNMKFEITKEYALLTEIETIKKFIKLLTENLHNLEDNLSILRTNGSEEIIESYLKTIEITPKNINYNFTINTHDCNVESPQELAEKFTKAIKKMK
jgi:biotin-(acetyl-CoA carboxylase) ligase